MKSTDQPDDRGDTGAAGEDIAAALLMRHGYTILHRNLRLPVGELDIVAARRGELRFVEVRTVRSRFLPSPTQSANPRKCRQVARVAEAYLTRWPCEGMAVSCDVVAVRFRRDGGAEVVWVKDAFGAGGAPL
jgi:putative endonuclease